MIDLLCSVLLGRFVEKSKDKQNQISVSVEEVTVMHYSDNSRIYPTVNS